MKVPLPVGGDSFVRPGDGLFEGMMRRRGEGRPTDEFFGPIVIEPVFPGLKAGDDRVACLAGVLCRVLGGRGVTASDVPAVGATTQVEPPASRSFTLHTPAAAGLDGCVDHRIRHIVSSGVMDTTIDVIPCDVSFHRYRLCDLRPAA
jgi:hypothetical protein